MDSFVGMSQRDLICDEEMDDDEVDVVEPLSRSVAFSGKRPATWNNYAPQGSGNSWDQEELEQDERDAAMEQPDLHEYFSQWVIPDKQVILLCRSYASYLAAKGHARVK